MGYTYAKPELVVNLRIKFNLCCYLLNLGRTGYTINYEGFQDGDRKF